MKKISHICNLILTVILMLSVSSCEDITQDIQEIEVEVSKSSTEDGSGNRNLSKVDHTDLVFGYAFSEDLLTFLEPTIMVYIDGKDPIEIPVTEGDMVSSNENIQFNSLAVKITRNDLYYCWKGLQVADSASGYMEMKFKEKYEDYSQFEGMEDIFDLESSPFVYTDFVEAGANKISLHTLTMINLSIGGKPSIENQIQSIINTDTKPITFNSAK